MRAADLHDQIPQPFRSARRHKLRAKRAWALCVIVAAATGGCGGSGPPAFRASEWIASKPSQKLAIITLRVHGSGAALGDINGGSRGQVLVQVPLGWRVDVRCVNQASAAESCAIVGNSLSATPAFAGAATPNPAVGLSPGASASFSFLANRAGSYRIASLVDDEEVGNATWDGFEVGGTAQPSARLLRRVP